jgi:hypothetical protein
MPLPVSPVLPRGAELYEQSVEGGGKVMASERQRMVSSGEVMNQAPR